MVEQTSIKTNSNWLPKDERILLSHYRKKLRVSSDREGFEIHELAAILSDNPREALNEYNKPWNSLEEFEKLLDDYPGKEQRIHAANDTLLQQGLIELGEKRIATTYSWVIIKLTSNGLNLGKKYNSPCWSIVLWCQEHINPWPRRLSSPTNN